MIGLKFNNRGNYQEAKISLKSDYDRIEIRPGEAKKLIDAIIKIRL